MGVTGWFAELICDVEPATIIITGSTPNVVSTTDTHIFPEPAMLTVIGERPGVNGPPVSPLPAEIAVTGGTPSIREIIAPADAEVTVTGSTPEIVQTANHLLQPTGASATVTGGTPVIVTGKILLPTAATVSLTGGTPRLVSQVPPTAATVTITGGRPLINVTYPPPTAQLTITGGRPLLESRIAPPWRHHNRHGRHPDCHEQHPDLVCLGQLQHDRIGHHPNPCDWGPDSAVRVRFPEHRTHQAIGRRYGAELELHRQHQHFCWASGSDNGVVHRQRH